MSTACRVPSVDGMNTSSRFQTIAWGVLAAGGFAWMTKMAVIAASDGANSGVPDTATAILWTAGVVLMAFGTAGVVAALLWRRHVLLGVLGVPVGLVAWAVTFVLIEAAAQVVVAKGTGPVWLHEEIGILATGAVLTAAGLFGIRRTSGLRFADPRPIEAGRR